VSSALSAARRIARVIEPLRRLGTPDAMELAAGLERWLTDPDKGSMDDALGLTLGRGSNDPRADIRRERRDRLLVEAADQLSPGADACEQSRILHARLSAYASGRWRHDRVKDSNPYRDDAIEHLFFEVFRLVDHAPVVGSLRRILRATKSQF
jgi:hypothetical protein